jgi:hypothetical protein
VYKGGGECLRVVSSPKNPQEEFFHDEYKPTIRFIEKSRIREKEIQPPLSIPKNKPLECGHYFVQDVVCNERPATHHLKRLHSQKQLLSPLKASVSLNQRRDPPPTTAEYVASPQWRNHEPEKWVGDAFVSTSSSSNPHTAQQRSITGRHYTPSVLISEPFCDEYKRHPVSLEETALYVREHERRVQTAVTTIRESHSPQKAERNYFASMWEQSDPVQNKPSTSPVNGGRSLMLQLRDQHPKSPKLQLHTRKSRPIIPSSPLKRLTTKPN